MTQAVRPVSAKLRWFACTTAVIAAMGATVMGGSLGFSFLYLAVPTCLIIGAIISASEASAGRYLMWSGAGMLSIWILPMGIEELFNLRMHHYPLRQGAASTAVVVFIAAIDLVLIRDALASKKQGKGCSAAD